MYIYKTEILDAKMKLFSDKANSEDVQELDKLLNLRASEGWELVTYSYMATALSSKGSTLVTFKKLKED